MEQNKEQMEQEILKKITPTPTQRKQIQKIIKELRKKITTHLKSIYDDATVFLVGSTAKDTYITHQLDIDFFIVFPPQTPKTILESTALTIGRDLLKNTEECYAEHPYIRGTYKKYKTEIVPCYHIKTAKQKISAVDRTPLHTTYIQTHLKEKQKQEVRLLKQFLKGINCYGAEAEIEGFSGYLCELLILKYNTFTTLIQQASHWKHRTTLTLTNTEHPSFDTPLTFIDPVDNQRNVASALSQEKFNLFVTACNAYLKNPQTTFFFPRTLTPWPLQKIQQHIKQQHYIGIKIKKPNIISENLYPQIRKTQRATTSLCKQYDFKIQDTTFSIQKKHIYIILKIHRIKLPATTTHEGPPTNLKKNFIEFQNKWEKNARTIQQPYIKNNRWYVTIKREYTDIETLLRQQIPHQSLGKDIEPMIKDHFSILLKKQLIKKSLQQFWTEYLDPRMTWER